MVVARILSAAPVLALAVAATFQAGPAAAQALPEEECAKLSDPEDEIICLRAALAASRQADTQVPPVSQPEQPRAHTAPVRAAPAPPLVQAQASDLGSEQVARAQGEPRAPDNEPEALAAVVSDFRTDRRGNLIMQLDNGQIWRQVENVDLPIRLDEDERIDVRITRSGFGGYRMNFVEMNRTISVSRIR